jgi:hypothetical protein
MNDSRFRPTKAAKCTEVALSGSRIAGNARLLPRIQLFSEGKRGIEPGESKHFVTSGGVVE